MDLVKDKTPQGRILRVKHGYNPNSSSMGSLIFALPASLMAVSGGVALVSGLIFSYFLKEHPLSGKGKKQDEKSSRKGSGS